jgi:hypothetical protein
MIGRPRETEAAPYYSNYINQVVGDNPLAFIEAQLPECESVCSAISEERSSYRYAPEKWSIRQLLSHLNDSERIFAHRALWFARGFDAALPGFDQEIAAKGAEAEKISWAAHVEEFGHIRRATISLFRSLPEDAWLRGGIASGNQVTVRALAFIIPGHVAHHLRILRESYLR